MSVNYSESFSGGILNNVEVIGGDLLLSKPGTPYTDELITTSLSSTTSTNTLGIMIIVKSPITLTSYGMRRGASWVALWSVNASYQTVAELHRNNAPSVNGDLYYSTCDLQLAAGNYMVTSDGTGSFRYDNTSPGYVNSTYIQATARGFSTSSQISAGQTLSSSVAAAPGSSVSYTVAGTTYATSGSYITPAIDISSLTLCSSADIDWTQTLPANTGINVYASLDNKGSWIPLSDGGTIPGIDAISTSTPIYFKYELTTSNTANTPTLLTFDSIFNEIVYTPGSSTLQVNERVLISGSSLLTANERVIISGSSTLPANENIQGIGPGSSTLQVNEKVILVGSSTLPVNEYIYGGSGSDVLSTNELVVAPVTTTLPVSEVVWSGTEHSIIPIHEAIFASGTGTVNDPYLIDTPARLSAIRNNLTAHYKLIKDIDMNDWGTFTPILSFHGTLDGNWHKITNVTFGTVANGTDYGSSTTIYNSGLFATAYGTIKRLGIEGFTTSPSSHGSGPFVAVSIGDYAQHLLIEDCYAIGTVYSNSSASGRVYRIYGGIVGYLNQSTINRCWSKVQHTGGSSSSSYNEYCGGIAAYGSSTLGNESTITDCYAVPTFNSYLTTYGVCSTQGTIKTNCFYEITSGETAEAKTQAHMKDISTFSAWDLTKWVVNSVYNNGYPIQTDFTTISKGSVSSPLSVERVLTPTSNSITSTELIVNARGSSTLSTSEVIKGILSDTLPVVEGVLPSTEINYTDDFSVGTHNNTVEVGDNDLTLATVNYPISVSQTPMFGGTLSSTTTDAQYRGSAFLVKQQVTLTKYTIRFATCTNLQLWSLTAGNTLDQRLHLQASPAREANSWSSASCNIVLTPGKYAIIAGCNNGLIYYHSLGSGQSTLINSDAYVEGVLDVMFQGASAPVTGQGDAAGGGSGNEFEIGATYSYPGADAYAMSGYRIANISLLTMDSAYRSEITWSESKPAGTDINIYASVDNGDTWAELTNGSFIPPVHNTTFAGKTLLIKQELITDSNTYAPTLNGMNVLISSQDGNVIRLSVVETVKMPGYSQLSTIDRVLTTGSNNTLVSHERIPAVGSTLLSTTERVGYFNANTLPIHESIKRPGSMSLVVHEKAVITGSLLLEVDERVVYGGQSLLPSSEYIIGRSSSSVTIREKITTPWANFLEVNEGIKGIDSDTVNVVETVKTDGSTSLQANEKISASDTKTLTVRERVVVNGSVTLPIHESIHTSGSSTLDVSELIKGRASGIINIHERVLTDGLASIQVNERLVLTGSGTLNMNEAIKGTGDSVLIAYERSIDDKTSYISTYEYVSNSGSKWMGVRKALYDRITE